MKKSHYEIYFFHENGNICQDGLSATQRFEIKATTGWPTFTGKMDWVIIIITSTSVFGDGRISTHADPTSTCAHWTVNRMLLWRQSAKARLGSSYLSNFGILGSIVPQNGRFLAINYRAKFDAASFILGREICNCTNTQNYKQKKQ